MKGCNSVFHKCFSGSGFGGKCDVIKGWDLRLKGMLWDLAIRQAGVQRHA